MKTILFVANNETALAGMIFLIDKILEYENVRIVLLCENCYHTSERYEIINLSQGINKADLGSLNKNITDFYNKENKKILVQIKSFIINYYKMSNYDKLSKKIIKYVRPNAIIVYSDRMIGILQGVMKNAGNIPIIRVPIAYQGDYRESLLGRFYNSELIVSNKKSDINRLMLLINKDWVNKIGNEMRAFYPLGYSIAGYIKHMVSLHPWVDGGGKSTHVFVTSENERDMILEKVNKPIIVTGQIEEWYILQEQSNKAALKEKLKDKYSVNRTIILAMPQMAEHNSTTWETHKKNMKKLLIALNELYGKILVSLHPKSNIENYRYLLDYADLSFVEERLRDVICGADVVITVSTSSIKQWADLLAVECVSIDCEMLMREVNDRDIELLKDSVLNGRKNSNYIVSNNVRNVVEEILKII